MRLKRLLTDIQSLFVGLRVTGKAFLSKNITVVYPREEVDNLASFRGHIELVGKEADPTTPKCVACGLCAKTCPSGCFTILCPVPAAPAKEGETPTAPEEPTLGPAPQRGSKTPAVFQLDFSLCSLCGLCIKSCASKAIQFSNTPYLVGFSRKEFQMDLLKKLHTAGLRALNASQQAAAHPEAASEAPANATPAATPAAEKAGASEPKLSTCD